MKQVAKRASSSWNQRLTVQHQRCIVQTELWRGFLARLILSHDLYVIRGTGNKLGLILVSLVLSFLSSCYMFGPADGGFKVLGSIRDNQGQLLERCYLELRNREDQHFYGPVPTKSGQFSTLILVAPYKADYWHVISCPGYESHRVLVTYGENTSPSKPLDLGEVVMKKEK